MLIRWDREISIQGEGDGTACAGQSTVELAVASLKNIFHDSKSAKPIVFFFYVWP